MYFAHKAKKTLLGAALMVASVGSSFACSCPPPGKTHAMRLLSYEHSKMIFSGIAIAHHEDHVTFKVSEIFKGAFSDSVNLSTVSSCSLIPRKGEEWIVYAEDNGSGNLIASMCLLSRRIDTISRFNVVSIPPPPPGQQQINTASETVSDIDLKQMDQLNLFDELSWLRTKAQTSAADGVCVGRKGESKSDMILMIISGVTLLLLLFAVIRRLL